MGRAGIWEEARLDGAWTDKVIAKIFRVDTIKFLLYGTIAIEKQMGLKPQV